MEGGQTPSSGAEICGLCEITQAVHLNCNCIDSLSAITSSQHDKITYVTHLAMTSQVAV